MSQANQRGSSFNREVKNFSIGGISGCIATTAILPMDYVKVQLQVASEGLRGQKFSPFDFISKTYRTKGILEFYSGLDSALLRQVLYATTRLGLYRSLCDYEKRRTGSDAISFFSKFLYSTISGGIGAIVGNPCDIALVRIQTDHSLPVEKRRNYKSVFDALKRIPKEEGPLAYWRGCTPTIGRAAAMNFGMLAPYDQTKEFLDRNFGVKTMNRIYSSFFAAFCACVISLPFDNIKTKYQRMTQLPDGTYPYRGFVDCFKKSIAKEGFMGLYVGFAVFVMRVGPNAVITLLTQDLLHHLLD